MPEMTDREKYEFVLGVYFRTQAAIEKYMGRERLPEWTAHVARMNTDATKKRLPERIDQERSVLGSLAKMLDVYDSDETLTENDGTYRLEVRRCGIFDYRERARDQGVELTLPVPCEFCVDLRYHTAANLGMVVSHQLGHRSCSWECHPSPAEDSTGEEAGSP
ncbi:hypothetical protein V1227_11600 [Lentzea sp. DG1S-22]|uniref:hypothetical protein n=1 Tax=Lentzea sp. DG1S-22 TaxID=3108822 RepID=UPI002E78C2B9|nr:hypothetical protein [Lentzea sp. DG1S-22]WVH83362.1 hypothetical protein V1227_11600 [Lentzea sp. DG1S-22]